MIISRKSNDLLLGIGRAIEDGRDPFHIEFLREHNISADDLMSIMTQIAAAIYGFATAPEWAQKAMITAWATKDTPGSDPAYLWLKFKADDSMTKLRK
jgi:hypothetical protein